MNNNNRGNNNSNNRRRGRGNNRPQGGGRGEQLNRIDSRARGNAPQMLEKYRKLASDAHLNGDRVSAESYLQFADHYFRVIADARVRQDEQRQPRTDRLPDDDGDDFEFGQDSDFPAFDQPVAPRRDERRDDRRDERRPYREEPAEPAPVVDAGVASEPRTNPFTRDNRGNRGLRERRERGGEPSEPQTPEEQHGFDHNALPPAISGSLDSGGGDEIEPRTETAPVEEDAVPIPRRRTRRPRATGGDTAGGPLEAVSG